MDLSFRLESFEGPLDLLLHLIEKNKVDIYDIPISEITDQYMEYISRMGKNAEVMSEFLVMAATLLDIKAKMLLPKETNDEGEEEDPRAELVQKLLEYKLYKYMSFELKDKELNASKSLYKQPSIPDEVMNYVAPIDLDLYLKDVTIVKLKAVFDDVMQRSREKMNEQALKFGRIKREEISIPDKISYVKKYTSEHKKFSFRNLLEEKMSKSNIIVTFLAILELMKAGELMAEQSDDDSDIILFDPSEALGADKIPEE